MDVVQAGSKSADPGDETNMIENTPITEALEKIEGGKIFTLNL